MKRLLVILLCLMLGVTLTACGPNEPAKTLSLDQVIILSEKGLSLSWNDFEGYKHEETSTKPYIRDYSLQEDEYSLLIKGNSLEESPLNIYLVNAAGESIDIRTDDIAVFLDGETQGNSEPEPNSSSTPPTTPPASSSQTANSKPATVPPVSSSQDASLNPSTPAVNYLQTLDDFFVYVNDSLTDDQYGGLQQIYNDSLVIWVVDQNAVDRVVNSYTGVKVKVVYKDASYSMRELKTIINELVNSEIAPLTKGIGLGDKNNVSFIVNGDGNLGQVESFLQSYKYKDAVSYFAEPEDVENPTT